MIYNQLCIKESYSVSQDSHGEQVKTWSTSTTIIGTKQGRTGSKSIVNQNEKLRLSERFYCNPTTLDEEDRLLFSTNVFTYIGTVAGSSQVTSTATGSLYNITTAFSTYSVGDYLRVSGSTFSKEPFNYYRIMYVNNVRNHHLQVDLIEDNQARV